uniref:Uncharacterized protein n=1 Tax=Junco hyemalis TaxID=40217 RepID=A0A8C5IGJ8_JUNHY
MVEKDESSPGGISEEEAAQYDRQIRLWGLEAQKRSVGLEGFCVWVSISVLGALWAGKSPVGALRGL